MKKIYFLLVVAVLSFTSCHNDIWNSINDLDSRVKALEELCREMNTNISSLQALIEVIQSGDYITNIVPITKGGEVIGYTIMFKNHEPITIYNGEDGITANTPVIGAAQDTDGVYYWTVNGEWLLDDNGNKIRVTGRDGQNGQDGQDGNDGQPGQPGQPGNNGQNGQNGADGITPTLKIENGMWYVSYDNGSTWTMLGQATGDPGQPGQPGQNGQDGESIFANITYDANCVVFTLSDGTTITVPRGNGGTTTTVPIIDGAIMAPFSVSDSTQIYFSRGILLYTPEGSRVCLDGSTKPGTFRFYSSQIPPYTQENGKSILYREDSEREYASDYTQFTGYYCCFKYGTSGYGNTNPIIFQPAGFSTPSSLSIAGSNYDWGVYNPIENGGNTPNTWRLLTKEEYEYLIGSRPSYLHFSARVNNRVGVVLLPDNWSNTSLRFVTVDEPNYNQYSLVDWQEFEKNGAVFIPLDRFYYTFSNFNNSTESIGFCSSSLNSSTPALATGLVTSTMDNGSYYYFYVGGPWNYSDEYLYNRAKSVQLTNHSTMVRLVKDVPSSSNN